MDILQFRGDTSAYLMPAPGKASLNLFKMLREGLLVAVRGALARAKRDNDGVREEGLRVRSDGGWREVDVVVLPLRGASATETGFLILFEEPAQRIPGRVGPIERWSRVPLDDVVVEQELQVGLAAEVGERARGIPAGAGIADAQSAIEISHGDEVIAAYDAPFPDASAKAGARAFPLLIPRSPEDPGAAAGQRVQDALREDRRPTLMLWADSDPVLPLEVGERFAAAIGRPAPRPIENASHFLQEDQGALIGQLIADWLLGG